MSATNFIRIVHHIEVPVPGRWPLGLGQVVNVDTGHGRHTRRTEGRILDGALVIAEDFVDSTLSFTIGRWTPDLDEPAIHFRGVLARAHEFASWRFAGRLTTTDIAVEATVDVFYRGVYHRGAKPVAWLTLQADIESPKHVGHRRVRYVFLTDLNALAPSSARLG